MTSLSRRWFGRSPLLFCIGSSIKTLSYTLSACRCGSRTGAPSGGRSTRQKWRRPRRSRNRLKTWRAPQTSMTTPPAMAAKQTATPATSRLPTCEVHWPPYNILLYYPLPHRHPLFICKNWPPLPPDFTGDWASLQWLFQSPCSGLVPPPDVSWDDDVSVLFFGLVRRVRDLEWFSETWSVSVKLRDLVWFQSPFSQDNVWCQSRF